MLHCPRSTHNTDKGAPQRGHTGTDRLTDRPRPAPAPAPVPLPPHARHAQPSHRELPPELREDDRGLTCAVAHHRQRRGRKSIGWQLNRGHDGIRRLLRRGDGLRNLARGISVAKPREPRFVDKRERRDVGDLAVLRHVVEHAELDRSPKEDAAESRLPPFPFELRQRASHLLASQAERDQIKAGDHQQRAMEVDVDCPVGIREADRSAT